MTEISSEPRGPSREVPIAGLGIRALSAIGDLLILGLFSVVYGKIFGHAPQQGFGFEVDGMPAGILFLAFFVYFVASEALWSASPAKRLFGLRIVREDDGMHIGWSESLIRNLLRIVDILPTFYLVGFFVAVSSPKTQRLGDRIARTVVIRV